MIRWGRVIRMLGSLILASLTTLASFGVLLAAAWAVVGERPEPRLAAALMSAGIAVALGGFIISWMAGSEGPAVPGAFGLLFGGASFLYVLGPDLRAILFTAAAVVLSVSGSLVLRLIRQRPESGEIRTSA